MADKVEEWDQREEQGSGNPAYDSPALKDPGWHGNLTNFMIIKKQDLILKKLKKCIIIDG